MECALRRVKGLVRMLRLGIAISSAATAAAFVGGYALAQAPRPIERLNGRDAAAREVLVRFRRQPAESERLAIERDTDADASEPVGPLFRRMRSRTLDVPALISAVRRRAIVEYAEPNYLWHATIAPNDPNFPSLWALRNTGQTIGGSPGVASADIHATSAWALATGSRANVVMVIDTGIDYTHPDLAANIWSAPASFSVTIGGQTIVCAAGTHGFNAITRTCDPFDDNNHGTHVSGTIGAAGNNALGVSGVNWRASIMGAKFLDSTGTGSTADAVNAIEFAIQARNAFASTGAANVRVLSNSWGSNGFSQALLNEVTRASANGMLFVAAAGNNASSDDVTPFYPANYTAPNVVAVAAVDNTDHLASFSNFGSSVHLAAPGVFILSTTIGNTYQYFSGTSMATPHVSGSAALILSKCALDTATLKATILNNVDALPSLAGVVATGGRLDVDKALRSCAPTSAPTPPSAPTSPAVR
jgi:subtilisin family serine protease